MRKHYIAIRKKEDIEWSDEMLGKSQEGVVVTRYSIHADVENEITRNLSL